MGLEYSRSPQKLRIGWGKELICFSRRHVRLESAEVKRLLHCLETPFSLICLTGNEQIACIKDAEMRPGVDDFSWHLIQPAPQFC